MSEERKRPRIRRNSVNRDEERGSERTFYRSREGGEDGENRFQRRGRRDEREEGRPFGSFGDRPRRSPRFGYIQDLNVEREKLAKGEPLGSDPDRYDRREYEDRDDNRRRRDFGDDRPRFERGERRFERRESPDRGDRPERRRREDGQVSRFAYIDDGEPVERREFRPRRREFEPRRRDDGGERRRRFDRDERPERRRSFSRGDDDREKKSVYSKKKQLEYQQKNEELGDELRLNRFIAKGGVCSRRDADALIQAGRVKVNGEVVDQLGVKVKRTDKVEVDGVEVSPERKVYIVLNKPKDYVTTMDDPFERKTVMSLIEGACKERVYPVGRLDRQTTGVLLFTNDGDLAKKLTHPSYNQKKIYHVFLDKAMKMGDLEAIMKGVELEDGFIQADDIRVAEDDNTQVGIEIHSGRNRIVRRIFEHFGYQILKLDRVFFAGITKKDLPRGRWRFLTQAEVNTLKTY